MLLSKQLAKHLNQVYFGGNWTEVNLKDTLTNITLETATRKIEGFNSILALTNHIHYFTKIQLRVLQEGILNGNDSESYDHPKLKSEQDWQRLLENMWEDAGLYIGLIYELPDSCLDEAFTNKKYGTYHSNIFGLIEHTHYHLGQIVILKKLIEKI